MVNSFCWEFLLHSHAALHGELLLVLHTLCWFMWGTPPVLVYNYMGSFFYMPSAGLHVEFLLLTPCWLLFLGVSLIRSTLASSCRDFLLFKTKRKNVKVNKNVHNWVMLLFKAEAIQAPQGCIMSSSRQCWNKYKHEMSISVIVKQ